jgi:hypothetical protein
MSQSSHGGHRPGAGRKPAPEGTQKIAKTYKLSPEIVEYLATLDNATAAIEAAIIKSKGFREWRRKK